MKIRLKELYSNINILYLYSVMGICLPFIHFPKIVQLDDIIFYEKNIHLYQNKHHFQDNSSKTLYSELVSRVKFVLVYWKTCPFFMMPTISYCPPKLLRIPQWGVPGPHTASFSARPHLYNSFAILFIHKNKPALNAHFVPGTEDSNMSKIILLLS